MRTDPLVHIKDFYTLFSGEFSTYLLIIRIFERAGRNTQIKREKCLGFVLNSIIPVLSLKTFHDVGPAEIPSRSDIQIHPHDLPSRHFILCVRLDDLFDDRVRHFMNNSG